ncbi:hypothetical protein [Olleya sp. HaHaR_3_96]|uniref:hypothetical protein n=1 Tax=Olleya sp. HaHaR_3_96 TaxID=2745560 RepID=UPI001C4F00B6|nr:hypothetical protein [Olleya sp. HaHaR_3_96]QXP58529.1 hypothetical protein H0I26_11425 [Olleya sp. HaHaR_3_96]
MIKLALIILGAILLTILIVWLIDKFIPTKVKPLITLALWALIACLGYLTFDSVYGEIKFNKLKEKRYRAAIERLVDIRDAQLAHRTVTGKFTNSYDDLIKFIENGKFTLVERRDSSVLDVERTKAFGGVEMFEEIVIIDTIGFEPVKNRLFKNTDRYKEMMNVPLGKEDTKFTMNAGEIEDEKGNKIPVFEAFVKKTDVLYDQDSNLVLKESQVQSVEGVNGDALRVGSMEEVKTIGNWPKTYGSNE